MRIEALMIRIFKEMLRDKRTLALMFIAPLFIMTLIFFLFQSNTTTKVDLAVHGVQTSLTKAMDTKHLRLHHVGTEKPTRIIKQHDYAGVLTQHGNQLTLTLANTDQGQSTLLKQTLQAATVKLRLKAAATSLKTQAIALNKLTDALQQATHGAVQVPIPQQPKQTNYRMTTHYRYGSSESTYFDTLLPILIGFIVFFFVFLISGIALLRERTTGTLYRLLATPIRRGEIISGYLLGYGIFAAIFLINLLLASTALALGLLISTFANSEFQMLQFIPIIVIPQIFFTGLIPVNQMLGWLQPIAHLMPLYYGANALTGIITKGQSLAVLYPDVIALVGFFLLFLDLNLLTMRKYRQV